MKTLEEYSEIFNSALIPGSDPLVHIHSRFDELSQDEITTLLNLEEIERKTFENDKRSEYFQTVSDFYKVSECSFAGIQFVKIVTYDESNDTWLAILIEV